MARRGRPPLPEDEQRTQVAFRFPPELLAFIDEWRREHGGGRSETVFWMLRTLMWILRRLGPRADVLLEEERENGQTVGSALALKIQAAYDLEESRASRQGLRPVPPLNLKDPHKR